MMRFLASVAASMLVATSASAAIVIDMREVGSDVIIAASGSLDTRGLAYFQTATSSGTSPSSLRASPPAIAFENAGRYDQFFFRSDAEAIGGSDTRHETSFDVGNVFAFAVSIGVGLVTLPSGYESGSFLAASMFFRNTSLADLGLTRGVYAWALPADIITINVGEAIIAPPPNPPVIEAPAVPEPTSWAMVILGFGAIGTALRRGKASQRGQAMMV